MNLKSYVIRETAVGWIINGVINAGFYFAVFHGREAPSTWGTRGLVLDCVPQRIMIGLMSVIVPTLLTRRAASKGHLSYGAPVFPAAKNLLLVGIAGSFTGLAAITGSAALLALVTGAENVPFGLALALKVAAVCLLPWVLTPLAIQAALSPPGPAATSGD